MRPRWLTFLSSLNVSQSLQNSSLHPNLSKSAYRFSHRTKARFSFAESNLSHLRDVTNIASVGHLKHLAIFESNRRQLSAPYTAAINGQETGFEV